MAVELNHTIVAASDAAASATWYADLFGLAAPIQYGPFWQVSTSNGVNLDFQTVEKRAQITPQHYAFLDRRGRLRRDLRPRRRAWHGLLRRSFPEPGVARSTTTTAVVACTSPTRTVTGSRSSPGRTAAADRRPRPAYAACPCSYGSSNSGSQSYQWYSGGSSNGSGSRSCRCRPGSTAARWDPVAARVRPRPRYASAGRAGPHQRPAGLPAQLPHALGLQLVMPPAHRRQVVHTGRAGRPRHRVVQIAARRRRPAAREHTPRPGIRHRPPGRCARLVPGVRHTLRRALPGRIGRRRPGRYPLHLHVAVPGDVVEHTAGHRAHPGQLHHRRRLGTVTDGVRGEHDLRPPAERARDLPGGGTAPDQLHERIERGLRQRPLIGRPAAPPRTRARCSTPRPRRCADP